MVTWLAHRLHNPTGDHAHKQRQLALFLVVTGFIRVVAWTTLGVMYLIGVPFTSALFSSVAFVALISLYANAATDFGQACASLAQLAAADAHSAAKENGDKVEAQEDPPQKGGA